MSEPGAEVKEIAVPAEALEEDTASLILLASTDIT